MRGSGVLQATWSANRIIILAGALAAVSAVLVALVVVLVASPVYRAEVHVSIRPRIADLGAAEAAARLVRNYAVWVDSEAYAARLATDARPGLGDAEVVRNVRTSGDADRMLVTIQSEDDDPARAAATVNGLAELLVAEVATPARLNDPQRGLEVALIDRAKPATTPVWPRPDIVLPVAGAIGALLGATFTWLIRPVATPPTAAEHRNA